MDLLEQVLKKGVKLSIKDGRLIIDEQKYQKHRSWFDSKKSELIRFIVNKHQSKVFIYNGYTTGRYGKQNYSGITLSFINLLTGENGYIIFNVCLDRKRTTRHGEKGSALPKGHFSVGKKSSFYKFWLNTGLEIPRRLSSFHDYMGKLRELIFMFEIIEKEKLNKASAALLSIEYDELVKLIVTDNTPTTLGQVTDNSQTKSSDKVIALPHNNRGFQTNQTTGQNNCGLSYQGSTDIRDSISSVNTAVPNGNQTNEEWLNDYNQYNPN